MPDLKKKISNPPGDGLNRRLTVGEYVPLLSRDLILAEEYPSDWAAITIRKRLGIKSELHRGVPTVVTKKTWVRVKPILTSSTYPEWSFVLVFILGEFQG